MLAKGAVIFPRIPRRTIPGGIVGLVVVRTVVAGPGVVPGVGVVVGNAGEVRALVAGEAAVAPPPGMRGVETRVVVLVNVVPPAGEVGLDGAPGDEGNTEGDDLTITSLLLTGTLLVSRVVVVTGAMLVPGALLVSRVVVVSRVLLGAGPAPAPPAAVGLGQNVTVTVVMLVL